MAKDPRQRKNDRVSAKVPVHVETGAAGVTRDVSPSGVYFVIDEQLVAGQTIRFAIEFAALDRGGPLHLDCVGTVLRVEDAGGKCGVAVAISESRLERRESSDMPVKIRASAG